MDLEEHQKLQRTNKTLKYIIDFGLKNGSSFWDLGREIVQLFLEFCIFSKKFKVL